MNKRYQEEKLRQWLQPPGHPPADVQAQHREALKHNIRMILAQQKSSERTFATSSNSHQVLKPYSFFRDFYVLQLRYIPLSTWLVHFLIVVGALLLLHNSSPFARLEHGEILSLFSATAPLLVLVGFRSVAASYVYQVSELELCTYHSLPKLLLTRLSLLGMVDLVCMFILAGAGSTMIGSHMLLLGLYLLVPFTVSCVGCLWILNRWSRSGAVYSAASYCGFMMLLPFLLTKRVEGLYGISATGGWSIILILSVLLLGVETRKLQQTNGNLEGVQ